MLGLLGADAARFIMLASTGGEKDWIESFFGFGVLCLASITVVFDFGASMK
jgi:hypothetical protein